MARLIVEKDPVMGSDTHAAKGETGNPASPTWLGTAEYPYRGRITDGLSDLVRIDGKRVTTIDSRSSLDPGEHVGATGTNPQPPGVLLPSLQITDEVGPGEPSAGAGSMFVSIGGRPVLLDSDRFDTCGTASTSGNSTVRSAGQSVVAASG